MHKALMKTKRQQKKVAEQQGKPVLHMRKKQGRR
jgi:hypothetical protein